MPISEESLSAQSSIHVPPTLPFILKQYAKAAIRTQPYDLLRWSATYFRALANGEVPPSKVRLEYDIYNTPSGLTPGYLKLLVKQFGTSGTVSTSALYNKWTGVCLNGNCLMEMLKIGDFDEKNVNWQHFLAIAAGHLTNSLSETMCLLCHVLTAEPAGGQPTIACDLFVDLYSYLARLDCGPLEEPADEKQEDAEEGGKGSPEGADATDDPEGSEGNAQGEDSPTKSEGARSRIRSGELPHVPGIGPAIPEVQVQATIAYMRFWAEKQRGFVTPRNMDNYMCPNIDEASERSGTRQASPRSDSHLNRHLVQLAN